jgi:hypothetical protein
MQCNQTWEYVHAETCETDTCSDDAIYPLRNVITTRQPPLTFRTCHNLPRLCPTQTSTRSFSTFKSTRVTNQGASRPRKNLPIKFAVSHKETLLERVSYKTALLTAIPEGPK